MRWNSVVTPGMLGAFRVARVVPPLALNHAKITGSACSAVRYGPAPVLIGGPW
jgi:hypothetical protein